MDSMLRTYRAFGLALGSEIPLPERQASPEAAIDCRFRMTAATTRAVAAATTPDPEDRAWITVERCGAGLTLRFPGIAAFAISAGGAEIAGWRARGVPLATVRHLLLDHVLPRVLDLRGALALHAGGVADEA